jgi:hypothetical protein
MISEIVETGPDPFVVTLMEGTKCYSIDPSNKKGYSTSYTQRVLLPKERNGYYPNINTQPSKENKYQVQQLSNMHV